MDAYWRAANYLSVGRIYRYDNPLLNRPLTLTGSLRGKRSSHSCQEHTTMLVTPESNRRNRKHALTLAGAMAVASALPGWFLPSCASLSGPLSVRLLVGSAALPPAVEDYGTAVPRFVGTGSSIARRVFSSAARPMRKNDFGSSSKFSWMRSGSLASGPRSMTPFGFWLPPVR